MRRNHVIGLVVFLAALALVFTLKVQTQRKVQANALQLVAPLNGATSTLGRRVSAVREGLQTIEQLTVENGRLKVENEKLNIANTMRDGLAAENDGLRRALAYKENAATKFQLVPARIIARSASTWWSNVQIDRGEQDGLDSDMPVVTDEGLVGKTTTVGANTASVLLLADENCKVAAVIEDAKEPGILSGERAPAGGQPGLSLNFLRKTSVPNLRAGMRIKSSGLGGVFPEGLTLGTITALETRALDARARVNPAVDLAKLENVFVIVSKRPPPAAPTPPPPKAQPVNPTRR